MLQEVVAYAETSMSRRKFLLIILEKNLMVKMEMVQTWMIMFETQTKIEAQDQVVHY
jgi:hypothetical protein